MSAFHPKRTSGTLGTAPNERCYVVGQFPSSRITADGAGSEPSFTGCSSRINERAQINIVIALKSFEEFDAVPAGDPMFSTNELIGPLTEATARLLVN
jgi:hypothetical protein